MQRMSTGWDEPRCVWCHKTGGTIEPLRVRVPDVPIFSDEEQDSDILVHAEHRDETRRYYARLYSNAHTFQLTMLFGVIALLVFAVLDWELLANTVVIYFGVVLVVFPFCNGTTFDIEGIKNSVKFARISGATFIIGGSILLYAGL